MSQPEAGRGHVLLLTGTPGVGKTTLLRSVAERIAHLSVGGFLTEEVRDVEGRRTGFRAATFGGHSRTIADVKRGGGDRVGRYGVDVQAIDELAEAELRQREDVDLYLIDEIGKMECLSNRFVYVVERLLESPTPVVATVGKRGGGFVSRVKERRDVELWEVTVANRDDLTERIITWIRERVTISESG